MPRFASYIPQRFRSPLRNLKHPARFALEGLLRLVTAGKIVSGPFVGLSLPAERLFLPILLGTYEKEIHPWLNSVSCNPETTILNIGAGDGVYAVGLARMFPQCRVLAYESQEVRKAAIHSLAKVNAVQDRVEVSGEFGPNNIASLSQDKLSLIIVDIEGFEEDFLDSEAARRWSDSLVIIETHDGFRAGNSERLKAIFSHTHQVDEVSSTPRTMTDWPLQGLVWRLFASRLLVRTMFEERPFPQSWLRFRPISASSVPSR